MIGVTTSPPHISMFRKFNTWYTIKDGNWSDPSIWLSNGTKKHSVPQPGDDVYVDHVVDYSNSLLASYLFNSTINNIFISGKLISNGINLNQNRLIITGNLICTGSIDLSTSLSLITIELRGANNFINSYNGGVVGVIQYNSPFNQSIVPITYFNLQISNVNIKFLTSDLYVTGTLFIDGGSTLDLSFYNSTINLSNLTGTLSKASSTGLVIFNNNINILNSTGSISFSASPVINISGNITPLNGDLRSGFNLGSGVINVLTTQTWTPNTVANYPVSFGNGSILIAAGKTLTIASPSGNIGGLLINGTASINGVDNTSTLNINGCLAYGNTSNIMMTGIFNSNNSGTSQIIIWTGVNLNLPINSFYDLTIMGTATLSSNTIVDHNLNINGGILQLANYDFTVDGATIYTGSLIKSGSGIVNLNTVTSINSTGNISFSGNPTVNLSGNITGDVRNGFNFGNGTVNIVSNLSIGVNISGNLAPIINWNIVIASGITLKNTGLNNSNSTLGGLNTTGSITGVDNTAIFDNRSVLTYQNALAPMSTGKLYCNQITNTFIYNLQGNQDITVPSDANPGYQNLILNNSGVKKILGDISVKGTYILTSPATLNLNGFTLTNP